MTLRGGRLLLLVSAGLTIASEGHAQRWVADIYAGGTRYDAIASYAAATNIVGNVRLQTTPLSAYFSAAAPIDADAPVWTALGGGARPSLGLGRVRLGIDIEGGAYAFRHTAALNGAGLFLHAVPALSWSSDVALLELRGGRHDHVFSGDTGDHRRHLYEIAARGTVGTAARFVIADVRMLRSTEQSFPMVRLQGGAEIGPVTAWASAGRWFGADLAGTAWGAGASTNVGARGELWLSVRGDVSDPLYQSPPRTSWNLGYSVKLGRSERAFRAPEMRAGSLVLRLPASGDAAPAVAGEFSEWNPLPMRRSGSEWVLEIPLSPGAYRFAFVSATGEWYVPDGYPGRMSDDMGGHVALVVVP